VKHSRHGILFSDLSSRMTDDARHKNDESGINAASPRLRNNFGGFALEGWRLTNCRKSLRAA
jgi:hypothetical protein